MISGTEDGEIFGWSMETYDLQFSIKGHNATINGMIFDTECKNIISGANDKLINVFDVRTGTKIYSTSLEHIPTILSWSGTLLLVGDYKGNLTIWDSQGATIRSKIHCHDGQ